MLTCSQERYFTAGTEETSHCPTKQRTVPCLTLFDYSALPSSTISLKWSASSGAT